MTILLVQVTQISNMKVIGFMVDFLKIFKLWHLSIEFEGEWKSHTPWIRSIYVFVLTIHPLLPSFGNPSIIMLCCLY